MCVGSPPISEDDIGNVAARNPLELWKQAFSKYFPQNSIRNKQTDDPSKDIQVRLMLYWLVSRSMSMS